MLLLVLPKPSILQGGVESKLSDSDLGTAMATAVHPSTNLRPLDPSRVSTARPWDQIQVTRYGGVQHLGRRGSQTYTQVQSPQVHLRLTALEKHLPQGARSPSPQPPQAEVVLTSRSHLLSPPLPPRSPALPSRPMATGIPLS
eukprot:1410665-Amphidinium_carterae.1